MNGEAFGLRADLKAELACLGQTLLPDAEIHHYRRPRPGENVDVVILDRVVEGVTPDYCIHGYVSCVSCHHLCWMGHETARVLSAGGVYPLCLDCAPRVLPADSRAATHLNDHRRADGPHL